MTMRARMRAVSPAGRKLRRMPGEGSGTMQPERVLHLELIEGSQLEDAAAFVVDLVEHPGSGIRVIEGQLELGEDLVVPGHPGDFELESVPALEPGTVWAIDGGSSVVADGRSFQVAAYRAARVRFRGGVTDLVESPSLTVRAT